MPLSNREMAAEAVFNLISGGKNAQFLFDACCEELRLRGVSAEELNALLDEAGMPETEKLKRAERRNNLRQFVCGPSPA